MDDKMFLLDMGKRISSRRKELRLTQESLAEKIGVSLQTISCVELGKKAIRPYNLIKLCAVLNISADYILLGQKGSLELAELDKQLSKLPEEQFDTIKALVDYLSKGNCIKN